MVRWWARGLAAAFLTVGFAAVGAEDFGTEIDLTAFGTSADATSSDRDDLPLEDVSMQWGTAPRRFYIAGMIGPSFVTIDSSTDPTLANNGTVFSAGGALGMAFERHNGQLRWEVEGMGRDTYTAPFINPPRPGAATVITNNWSVLTNLWRDLMFTDRFGAYGGAGIGAGGYVLGERFNNDTAYAPAGSAFAWQGGGGLLWNMSDRLTFDVGYRYFQIDSMTQSADVNANQYAASELMFTLRLYEPFRNWRR